MPTKFQVLSLLPVFTSLVSWLYAATINCTDKQYWNGSSCAPCSSCPVGYGLVISCTVEEDTYCQPCLLGYEYSDITGMEPCLLCSPVCGGFQVETRNCTTEHDRVCTAKARSERIPSENLLKRNPSENLLTNAIPKVTAKKDDMHTTVGVLGPKRRRTPLEQFMIVCITMISTLLGFAILTAKKCKSKRINYHEKLELMSIQSDNDDETQLTVASFYSEPASTSFPKLMVGSPSNQEYFDLSLPVNPYIRLLRVTHVEEEDMVERKMEWEHDWTSKNSSASDISSMMWNISNLRYDEDPKMVACGLVDHNRGKFPGDTAVNLDFSTSSLNQDDFDFPPPAYEPCTQMHAKAEGMAERKTEWEHDCTSKNSSASDISRAMWNISNLPDDADPKMVACGLVDHNGGKLAIGDTGVSLTIPPQAIPEGRTEGIFIAIMNQEKEHPKVTSKEPLLSPVVTCGPNGLVFDRHVILSLPHCALLGDGSWNLKVQYNESDPGRPANWKELIDVTKQDGSEPHLAIVEPTMVHIMVDHFTGFTVTGEPASRERAKKAVRIVAYVTPPEASGNCVVRVYCVGDTPAHLEGLHDQELEKLRGITMDAPKPFHLRDGGGDVLVKLTNYHLGWTKMCEDQKKIYFQHIWEGIERMPCCTFVFSLAGESVPQFHAAFGVKQDCQDGDEQEVIVSTPIKETQQPTRKISAGDAFADVLNAVSFGNPTKSLSPANVPPDACTRDPIASPSQTKDTSSGFCSYNFEPLQFTDSLTQRIRYELILLLDPPHLTANWKHLAEDLGLETKQIRWLEYRKPPASPTDTLLTVMENRKYPLSKLAKTLLRLGRDDAAKIIEDQLMLKETSV